MENKRILLLKNTTILFAMPHPVCMHYATKQNDPIVVRFKCPVLKSDEQCVLPSP